MVSRPLTDGPGSIGRSADAAVSCAVTVKEGLAPARKRRRWHGRSRAPILPRRRAPDGRCAGRGGTIFFLDVAAALTVTGQVPDSPLPRAPRTGLSAVAAGLAALALIVSPASAGSDTTVAVRSISYDPPDITVSRATTVRWENVTSPSRVHDVVSSIEGAFASPLFGAGESFSHRFDAGGTYTYICTIHDVMLGVVRVPIAGRLVERSDGIVMRLRLATDDLPADSPFRYVVLRRDPGSADFRIWRFTRERAVAFSPPAPGSYEFVMRLKNVTSGRKTGPAGNSPVLRLDWEG